jgi:hypothetical protein
MFGPGVRGGWRIRLPVAFVRFILLCVSTQSTQPQVAGWYADPAGGSGQRWHDGQGWTGQVSYAKPRTPLGSPFAKLADWLSRLLVANCVLNLLALPLMLWTRPGTGGIPLVDPQLFAPTGVPATSQPGVAVAPAAPVDVPGQLYVALVFLMLVGLLYAVTGLVWLIWQARIAAAAPAALKSSPTMHVLWWFVPFANWWMPVRSVSDLWRSYGATLREARTQGEQVVAPPVFLWWTCWLVSGVFVLWTYLAVLGGSFIPQTSTLTLLGAVGAVCLALAAAMGALVVRQLSWVALLSQADAAN